MVQITITPHTLSLLGHTNGFAFTAADVVPLRDKHRFKRAFARSKHNIHFVLDSRRVLRKGDEPFQPVPSPRKVTIVLSQNASQDQLPLTPWILAHRIGHCFQAGTGLSHVERQVFDVLDEVIRVSAPTFVEATHFSFSGQSGMSLSDHHWDVIASYLDTRCARQHRIINPLDIFAECIASYLIRGTVKLRQPEVVTVFRDSAFDFRHDQPALCEYEAKPYDVCAMEQKLNAILDSAFTALRGKILSF